MKRFGKKSISVKKAVTLNQQGASISAGSLRKAPAGVSSKGYPPVSRSEFGSPSGIFTSQSLSWLQIQNC